MKAREASIDLRTLAYLSRFLSSLVQPTRMESGKHGDYKIARRLEEAASSILAQL